MPYDEFQRGSVGLAFVADPIQQQRDAGQVLRNALVHFDAHLIARAPGVRKHRAFEPAQLRHVL